MAQQVYNNDRLKPVRRPVWKTNNFFAIGVMPQPDPGPVGAFERD